MRAHLAYINGWGVALRICYFDLTSTGSIWVLFEMMHSHQRRVGREIRASIRKHFVEIKRTVFFNTGQIKQTETTYVPCVVSIHRIVHLSLNQLKRH